MFDAHPAMHTPGVWSFTAQTKRWGGLFYVSVSSAMEMNMAPKIKMVAAAVASDALLTKQLLALRLAVNPATVDRWRRDDPTFPPPVWLSGITPRWRPADIDQWLSQKPKGGVAPDWSPRRQSGR
jgi:predicted DNA-binding transcriptional regulator AlpA